MIKDYDLSPNQDYLLIKKIKKPFSYLVPYYRFPYIVKTIDLNNKQEKTKRRIGFFKRKKKT